MNKLSSNGVIQNEKRLNQKVVFRKLSYKVTDGDVTSIQSPTDVELEFEFANEIYIRVEYKVKGNEMPVGQQITFTRVINALQKGGYKNAYLIIAEHEVPAEQDICAADDAFVTKIYHKNQWSSIDGWSVRNVFESIFEKHNIPLQQIDEYQKQNQQKLRDMLKRL